MFWFWVFGWVLPRVLPIGLRWVYIGCYGLGVRWGCMIRKWKWSSLTVSISPATRDPASRNSLGPEMSNTGGGLS